MVRPEPSDPVGGTNNFLYAGTVTGHVYVSFQGGGSTWMNINNGDLSTNTFPILQIITNPNRGSHEAYAITTNGVYHIANSDPNATVPDGAEDLEEDQRDGRCQGGRRWRAICSRPTATIPSTTPISATTP